MAQPATRPTVRDPIQVVHAWVAAVNAGDVPATLALTASDVEMHGPRGTHRGHPAVREWIERARLHMDTRRTFAAGDAVVLLQEATWRDDKGIVIGQATMANRFGVAGGRVAVVGRYEQVEHALRDAGLTEDHERPQ